MARQKRRPVTIAARQRGRTGVAAADAPRESGQAGFAPWQWRLIAIAIPIFLLASRLTLDLWEDEVYTLYDFAVQPISQIVSDYSAPNNHILYSLVLHPVAALTQSEPALRAPSLLFAVGTSWILFRIAWRTLGPSAAVAATLALGLNVMFLTHAVQVRGYSLSMLLAAWLLDRAIPETRSDGATGLNLFPARWRRPRSRAAFVALGGAGFLYVMPTNALFLAPLAIVAVALAWRQAPSPDAPRWLLPIGWLLAWPLALLAYWPVLAQVRAAGGAGDGMLPLAGITRLVRDVYWAAGHDLTPLLIAIPVVAFRVVQARRGERLAAETDDEKQATRRNVLAVLAAMLVGPFVCCAVLGTAPFVRTFCPLLPALALGVGWFVSLILGDARVLLGKPDPRKALPAVSLVFVALILLLPVIRYPSKLDLVRTQRFAQDGYYNFYAADFEPSRVARYLESAIQPGQDYLVLYADGDHYNLVHYLARAGLPVPPRKLSVDADGKVRARLFCVTPELAQWDELSRLAGIPVEQMRRFPLADRVGYYRIYASPDEVELPAGESPRN